MAEATEADRGVRQWYGISHLAWGMLYQETHLEAKAGASLTAAQGQPGLRIKKGATG